MLECRHWDQLSDTTMNPTTFWSQESRIVIQKYMMALVVFIWSIFIRTVIGHMTCYDLNWPKIKFWVHYFVFSCDLDHILKSYKSIYIPTIYKIRYILEELYVAVMPIISRLIIYIDQLNEGSLSRWRDIPEQGHMEINPRSIQL